MLFKHCRTAILITLSLIILISSLCIPAAAQQLTDGVTVDSSDGQSTAVLTDDNIYTYDVFSGGTSITVTSEEMITGLYIMWNKTPGTWSYEDNGNTYTGGGSGFLHEYISLEEPTTEVILNLPEDDTEITDIYAFSEGELPDWVQVWEEPVEQADILLFAAHSDDEQLFFAGLLPYYILEAGATVQVVFMTHHWDTDTRNHELLDGLWTVGVRNYPVLSDFIDNAAAVGDISEGRETVLERARNVYDEDEWVLFQTRQLRRFQPQVVVSHDLNGEYGHGAHIMTSDALTQAVELSADASYDPDSVEEYGVWDVPKTYFHLYEDRPIVLNYDTPYESMGNRTPFEMSKLGYACHLSQQWTWFTRWITVDKASEIEDYSPCLFGLYRTTVGEDSGANDFLENIELYSVQQEREEEDQQAAEEQENGEDRQAEEAQQAEEKERQTEGEQQAEDEQDTGEEQQAQEVQNGSGRVILIAAIVLVVILIVVVCVVLIRRNRKK